ncbi:MAG: alanine racemase [Pseudomonadota bacterium]
MARNTLAQIDRAALAHNLERIRELAPGSRVMAVVKADAYGHRLDLCLPALDGADLLAVATIEEARAIRRLGCDTPVLLLEGILHDEDLPVVEELGLELTIHHESQLTMLEAFGRAPCQRVWLKIDTGMHRLGVPCDAAAAAHARLKALGGIEQVNLMTHFASADDLSQTATAEQIHRFDETIKELDGERCLANSAAVLNFPDSRADWVRAGILLYGISPLTGKTGADLGLQPVMTLKSELMAINQVKAGENIGYGGRYRAARDLTVGVAAIGYGDGYPRHLVDGTPVQIAGKNCALAGRVSMDMITIDLSNCPEAQLGDDVVLWGGDLAVEEIALHADTIPYELVCRITRRVRYRGD